MTHQYVRRTYDEAEELAKAAFKAAVSSNLSEADIDEIRSGAQLSGGTPNADWGLGFIPTDRTHYEIEIYKSSAHAPYIEKSFVRMLVPRNKSDHVVHFKWHPPLDSASITWKKN